MSSFFELIFNTVGFPPRWYCGSAWTQELGWTHIIADFTIFVAYLSIPVGIFIVSRNRSYLNYRLIIWLFIFFIICCGVTHLIEALIFWYPWYRFSALLKVITAIISVIAAFALFYYAPRLLKISDNLYERHYLEHIIKNVPFPILMVDSSKKISFVNNYFIQYTGYKVSDVVGSKVNTIALDYCKTKLDSLIIQSERESRTVTQNIKISDNVSEIKNVELSIVCLNHFGKKEFILTLKDMEKITELNFVSTKLNAIFDGAADAIFIYNNSGKIQFCNRKAIDMFKHEYSDLISKNFYDLIAGNEIEKLMNNTSNDSVNKIKKFDQIFTGITKDQKEILLEISGGKLNIDNIGIYTVFLSDVSNRIKMEQKIKRAYEELEKFSYVAAHDLREPLRGIGNYSTFLLEDYGERLDENGIKMLNSLKKLSYRLENFIESLLHYSRISNEKNRLVSTDLNVLIRDVLDSLNININENNVKIIFEDNFPTIKCQKIKIREVFYNLISNAIRYNLNKEKTIEIGYKTISDNKKQLRKYMFFVKDNGIGIEQRHYEIVFNMFKRLHSKEDFGGGSGAGLAIVKKIVEQHDGQIWIESTKSLGTTFYFTISNYE